MKRYTEPTVVENTGPKINVFMILDPLLQQLSNVTTIQFAKVERNVLCTSCCCFKQNHYRNQCSGINNFRIIYSLTWSHMQHRQPNIHPFLKDLYNRIEAP